MTGTQMVILRRLQAVEDAVRAGDRVQVEFRLDQLRSSLEREFGTRGRATDALRADRHGRLSTTIGGHRFVLGEGGLVVFDRDGKWIDTARFDGTKPACIHDLTAAADEWIRRHAGSAGG